MRKSVIVRAEGNKISDVERLSTEEQSMKLNDSEMSNAINNALSLISDASELLQMEPPDESNLV